MRFVLPFLLVLSVQTAQASDNPAHVNESGWSAEGFVDPTFEAERAQIAFDDQGHAISVWAGRTTSNEPFRILWSTLTGTAWSPAVPAFPTTTASERLPQLSRAADGTVWAAWLRDDNFAGTHGFTPPTLVAARLSGGTWSPPETVVVATPVIVEKTLEINFSLLAVSHDEAWVAWTIAPDGDVFSNERDLYSSRRTAAGWSPQVIVSDNPLTETRPLLVRTSNGQTTAIFAFANAPSLLRAVNWTGSAWSTSPTDLTAPVIYGFDAAPDSGGAIRLIVDLREEVLTGLEYHIREFELNESGFHSGPMLTSAPVLIGGENDPPDWSSVSISSGRRCPLCTDPANELVFRVMWVDFSQGGVPKVFSTVRNATGYRPFDLVGTSFETAYAFPKAVHDAAIDRWYATWTAPPNFGGRKRAKFAYTQEFAGDLAIGGNFISPDTVRVTVVGSGDATGRTFRLYRLNWPASQGTPPFSPPVPAEAVALPDNPYSGTFPLTIDDFPGEGRWFYYVELDAQGTLPARSARSFLPAVVPQGGGGGGEPGPVTRLLSPSPQPAVSTVRFPFDLATAGHARLYVRDLRGRLVRTFDLGALPAGAYHDGSAPQWAGLDERGAQVPSGMYFATLTVDGEMQGPGVRVVYFP